MALAASVLADGMTVPRDGPPLWDGHAGERIAAVVADWLRTREDGG